MMKQDTTSPFEQFARMVLGGRIHTVSFMLNDCCSLGCRHCAIGYSKNHVGSKWTMEPGELEDVVKSIDPERFVMVGLEGGEPQPKNLIRLGLSTCHSRGLLVSLTTAPVWASTKSRAAQFLEGLETLDRLFLSLDHYHLERIPLANYWFAVEAATTSGVAVQFLICHKDARELERVKGLVAPLLPLVCDVTALRMVPMGNASDIALDSSDAVIVTSPPDLKRVARCCTIGHTYIDSLRRLHACSWSVREEDTALRFEANNGDLRVACDRMWQDAVIEGLIARGGFIEAMSNSGLEKVAMYTKRMRIANECHLCLYLMRTLGPTTWRNIVMGGIHM